MRDKKCRKKQYLSHFPSLGTPVPTFSCIAGVDFSWGQCDTTKLNTSNGKAIMSAIFTL